MNEILRILMATAIAAALANPVWADESEDTSKEWSSLISNVIEGNQTQKKTTPVLNIREVKNGILRPSDRFPSDTLSVKKENDRPSDHFPSDVIAIGRKPQVSLQTGGASQTAAKTAHDAVNGFFKLPQKLLAFFLEL